MSFSSISTSILAVLLIVISVILLYSTMKQEKTLEEKNQILMNYHLELKFIYQIIFDNLNIPIASEFCSQCIEKLKKYYDLIDIVIIDSINMMKVSQTYTTTILGKSILDYIENNKTFIEKSLSNSHKISTLSCNLQNIDLILHIVPITAEMVNDGIIICVEKAPTLLDEHEIASLYNILNILRKRIADI
ncbi:hypothetical protein [Rickettsia endosymbiont of Cardiosporidium cionae]|uniref:hypothetical protein n=1 Tax=Rickettsia endosymbiont of Cardiosporidium cionae TaxID=2777155 RepID=UPI0018944DC1|nr:hypothetical protein [Rickettsia endosymbiont of Cardiosporidium cionae]KAF8818507.1 hypothetical protein IHI24_000602 [Rickettsia endosymbiont of Cardiosporidium cionae]